MRGGRRRERGHRGGGGEVGDGQGQQRGAPAAARAAQERPVRAPLGRVLPADAEGGGGGQGRRPARARSTGLRRREGRRARPRGPRVRRRRLGRRVGEEKARQCWS